MALIADVGSPNANSYVTVAEANEYFSNRLHSEVWEEFDGKAPALITASNILDWYLKWKGSKSTSTQSMEWPRVNAFNKYGVEIADNIIPEAVKQAVFELALSSIPSDRIEDNPTSGYEQMKIGSLMLKMADGVSASSSDALPDKIWKILSGLYQKSNVSVIRLVRA